jgi:hypothetical protein
MSKPTYGQLLDLIKRMHKLSSYKIAPNDDRLTHLPFEMFDEVEMTLADGGVDDWREFLLSDLRTGPSEYGTYEVCRKDGKMQIDTWNSTGWANNNNSVILFYKPIVLPINFKPLNNVVS